MYSKWCPGKRATALDRDEHQRPAKSAGWITYDEPPGLALINAGQAESDGLRVNTEIRSPQAGRLTAVSASRNALDRV